MANPARASAAKHPVFIGVAWPYANGPLHLGHVAGSLLPPDIFRRYSRMAGHPVLMVSGSDCHGTPIMIQAEKEGKTPAQVVEHFHRDHVRALERLGIGFDLFTTTTTANHRAWVQRIFLDCQSGGYIESRTSKAPYDPKGQRFLPDRYVEGTCPHCGNKGARGDQCDACGKTLDPQDLKDAHSKLNPGTPIEFRATEHFYFLLSKLQPALEAYVRQTAGHWRANTINFTETWLREGLQDRAITRDLTWGVPIPIPGFNDKRIYVWFEAVCGYLTAAVEWAQRRAEAGQGSPDDWKAFWLQGGQDGKSEHTAKAYYFLGKDNIPFHTIIWPAILLAENEARAKRGEPQLNLPWDVPANEFLNLFGLKFSKSQGVGIGVHEVLDRFEADAVRYYLSINMPEGKDADWQWPDFASKVNDELVGTLGNLVNRVVSFSERTLKTVPSQPASTHVLSAKVADAVQACHDEMALHLQAVRLRPAMRRLMELAVQGNQWMQEAAPWSKHKTDPQGAADDLHALLRLCRGLSVLMAPFLPTAAQKTWTMLGEPGSVHDQSWAAATGPLRTGAALGPAVPLFAKLDPKAIEALAGPPAEPKNAPGQPKASGPHASAHAGHAAPAAPSATPPSGSPVPNAAQTPPQGATHVTIDEFQRIQLRIAKVLSVAAHPKADKLYVIRLDAGELGERQVVAGLKAYYQPEELVGQTLAFVANLQPAMLRGVESQGMILAGDDGSVVAVLNPHKPLPPGSRIR